MSTAQFRKPLPDPLEICIEDLDHPQFVRCVALPGGEPGLGVGEDGSLLWRSDEATACELWVSADGRLVLLRPTGASAVVVRRAGRFVDAPCEKPVVLLHQDLVEVAGRRLRVHVHGVAQRIAPPTILEEMAQAASAMALGGALLLGGLSGCAEESAAPQQLIAPRSTTTPVAVADAGSEPLKTIKPIEVRENMPKPMAREYVPASATPSGPAMVPSPALRSKVLITSTEVESKDIDREKLATYVRSRVGAPLQCYDRELRRNPSLKGKLVVRFSITPAGRSAEIGIEENSLDNEPVAMCVKTIIRGWVFPFKPDTETVVAVGFVFTPQ